MFPIQMKFRCFFSLIYHKLSKYLNTHRINFENPSFSSLRPFVSESKSHAASAAVKNFQTYIILARGQRSAPSDAPSLPFVLKLLWFRNDGNHFLSYFFNYSLHKQLSQKRKHQFRRKKCQYSMQIIIHVFRINPNLKHRFEFLTGTTTLTCVEEVYIDQPVLYKLSHILLGASGRTVQ